jgi:protein tyrosine/serine phosphatase
MPTFHPLVRERPIAEGPAGIAEQSAGSEATPIPEQSAGSEASPTEASPKQRVAATTARVLAYTLLLALSACVYISPRTLRGACSNDLDSPIRNFCVVTPGTLWRGPRPDASDAQWLLDHGLRSIISLQLNDKRAFENAAAPPDLSQSLPYFQVPGFNPFQVLSATHLDDHVALFLAIMKQAPKPIYVHCRAGVDRTGVVAAAYQVMIEGADPEQVIADMARWHSPWYRIDAKYIRQLTPAREAQILRKAADLQARLRPSATIDCQRGKCAYVRNKVDPTVKASPRGG